MTEQTATEAGWINPEVKPVSVWPIERAAVPALAMLLWESLNPGERPATVSDEERKRYIDATRLMLDVLEEADNVKLYP